MANDPSNLTCSAQVLCEPGFFCRQGVKYNCPEGTYGSEYGLYNETCNGMCREGFMCPSYPASRGSTRANEQECGGSGVFCPEGTGNEPVSVSAGYYAVGGDNTNQTRSAQVKCEPGFYCKHGVKFVCPVGRYGSSPGLKDEYCSGRCKQNAEQS